MENSFKPYVPAKTNMKELTFKAVFLGILLAVVLGAANAYLGLKAGMTISAAFPAAVIAIAAFRLPFLRGTVLEQNIARTTASVGEALAAGAIFTIPAFVMVSLDGERLWTEFKYWDVSLILLVGGLLGILFVILLRRTLVIDAHLPYPEGVACFEIVKSGQGGESGAKYVFGALGLGILIEMLKNSSAFAIFKECKEYFISFPASIVHHFNGGKQALASISHKGGVAFQTPLASPALMAVGYIIGPKYASINFAGGALTWLVIIPFALFLNPQFIEQLSAGGIQATHMDAVYTIWYNIARPIAVGAMLIGSLHTLWGLRGSLLGALKGIFSKNQHAADGAGRLGKDLNLRWIFIAAIILTIPMFFLYNYFCSNTTGAFFATIIMFITAFLFAAVGGWLVGLMGNSNQPVSGLTIATLVIAALVMISFGVTGLPGIAAVLGVAAVVCCVACLAGDMIQDLKVGQLIGGTPWKMQVSEILGVIVVAFVIVFPIIVLHEGNIAAGGLGIGDAKLPAPQAGLMAQLAKGIVTGDIPWGLIIIGMFFSGALILIKAPAPVLFAVGMYLPFEVTFAIFVGGTMKWFVDWVHKKRGQSTEGGEGKGILLASGFIAGEALTGVLLAGLVLVGIPSLSEHFLGMREIPLLATYGGWLSLIVFGVVAIALIGIPLRKKA